MDMTNEQIIAEFRRQVKLCIGIGYDKMVQIINEEFPPQHEWRFYANGTFCIKCGTAIGTRETCIR